MAGGAFRPAPGAAPSHPYGRSSAPAHRSRITRSAVPAFPAGIEGRAVILNPPPYPVPPHQQPVLSPRVMIPIRGLCKTQPPAPAGQHGILEGTDPIGPVRGPAPTGLGFAEVSKSYENAASPRLHPPQGRIAPPRFRIGSRKTISANPSQPDP